MKTSATDSRACAFVRLEKRECVGHDIGLMVAYAYAAQFPDETESSR